MTSVGQVRVCRVHDISERTFALMLSADPSEAMIHSYVRCSEVYELLEDETVAGVLALLKTKPRILEIVNLAIDPRFQRRGMGTLMVEYAKDRAQALAMISLEVGTGSTSSAALRLYQRCGFAIDWVDKDYFPRHYQEPIVEDGLMLRDMILLSCPIASPSDIVSSQRCCGGER